jgi:hypothetical protein
MRAYVVQHPEDAFNTSSKSSPQDRSTTGLTSRATTQIDPRAHLHHSGGAYVRSGKLVAFEKHKFSREENVAHDRRNRSPGPGESAIATGDLTQIQIAESDDYARPATLGRR